MTKLLAALLLLFATAARAEPPRVAVDLPPIAALVAQVMGDLGRPEAFLTRPQSPHGYQLRPSEAATLADADLVIWTGAVLMPDLSRKLVTLAPEAASLDLMASPGTTRLPLREHGHFHRHDHDDHGEGHDGAGHAGEHGAEQTDDHGHEAGPTDPHGWLDPENARTWLAHIAEALAQADPENATAYRANAEAARADLATLGKDLAARLAPVAQRPLATTHDAFAYFETRFGLASAGTVSLADGTQPGPRDLARLRADLADRHVACILIDSREGPRLLEPLMTADGPRTTTHDPLGSDLTPGPGLYATLLTTLADRLADCLSG